MPKKNFKDNPALAFIGNTQVSEPTVNTTEEMISPVENGVPLTSPDGPPIKESTEQKYYRFNLNIKAEHKEFLDWVSWSNKMNKTQYINELIAADKKKRGTEQ